METLVSSYWLAKAAYDALEAEDGRRQAVYCAERGFVTKNGEPATRIAQIHDGHDFSIANQAYYDENVELEIEQSVARKALRAAKNALIAFGVNVMPDNLM